MLTNRLLNADESYNLWVAFGKEVGLEKLKESYGSYWPRKPVKDELVFTWFDDDRLIGWTAIRQDLLEPVFWVNVGIFPDEYRRGYNHKIFWPTIKIGFETFPQDEWGLFSIALKNHENFITKKKEFVAEKIEPNSECAFIYVGQILVPEPGYTIFGVSRDMLNKIPLTAPSVLPNGFTLVKL